MKTLILGASGCVGGILYQDLQKLGPVVGTYCTHPLENLIHLNITDPAEIRRVIDQVQPDLVLQPAAMLHVDGCEENPAESHRVNVEGTRNVVEALRGSRAKHVFFSTDYVFDGKAGPYSENDPTNPIQVYGQHKLEAERVIQEVLGGADSIAATPTPHLTSPPRGEELKGAKLSSPNSGRVSHKTSKGRQGDQTTSSPLGGEDKGEGNCSIVSPSSSRTGNYLIIRSHGVFGWERQGKNFVVRLIQCLRQGKTFTVPSDQIGSPTYASNLSDALQELIRKDARGIYHVVGSTIIDRYSFARLIANIFSLDEKLIIPKTTRELNQKAARPLKSALRIDKARRELSTRLWSAEESLRHMKATESGTNS